MRIVETQASNAEHLKSVLDMGITMVTLGEGKVQLLHSFYNVSRARNSSNALDNDFRMFRMVGPMSGIFFIGIFYSIPTQAKTPLDAERGLLFMQEMMELTKQPTVNIPTELQAVFFRKPDKSYEILMAGPSHFSPELRNEEALRQQLAYAQPFTLCKGEWNLWTCNASYVNFI